VIELEMLQKLIDVLSELKAASLAINSENDLRETMNKYDMLFLGGKFNSINTLELRHSLQKVFDLEFSNEELLKLIPSACELLNMKKEPMVSLENPDNLAAYIIYLF
jgi:acyl carrier protein